VPGTGLKVLPPGNSPNFGSMRQRAYSSSERTDTMKTMNGGSAVRGGYYLSKSHWEIFPIAHDGEKLPGPASEHYVKVPTAVALGLMPVLGGLMVVFLPFIGLYLAAKTAVGGLTGAFNRSAKDLAATVTPGWAPGAAHLTGKATDKDAGESKAGEHALEELKKEIEEKRNA
jgi:hypothetical protein